ncbi:malto-oligosyltrehalose synthase [Streptomyces sp. NPDC089919]|uniref:malto-oligosyltrehalose synthase n=1 Tax=Streptomyces sp. NPDC089919 TaxID=3155188 RepID=UPI003438FF13
MTEQYSEQYADRSPQPSAAPVPTATYRLQLQPGFPFAAAAAAVPYLASLGVSHLHLSPALEAVPGSSHGYDVVDHTRVRAELGGEDGLRALAATARRHGLGLVLDLVPNHMAVPTPARLNRPLWEVLKEGRASPYAAWFDIDWEAGDGQLLMPVLAEDPGHDGLRTAEGVRVADGVLHYGPYEFPVRPGTEGLPQEELLAAQFYRPVWWRLARTDLNYRRFFTISDLIGVRVEDPEVFAASHDTVLRLVREGLAEGLRIDHPDGLADPAGYLRRLAGATGRRTWTVVEKILAREERLPADWRAAGTTGYDALYRLDGVLTDPAGAAALADAYRTFTGLEDAAGGRWEPAARQATAEVLEHDLVSEVETLVRMAAPACAARPDVVRTAVRGLLARVPVYRPYPGGDPAVLPRAADVPGDAAVTDRVRELALGADPAFEARFAQTSAALRAKSLEDRAFYRFAPLLSATEVGGDPGRPAVQVAEFHAYCARTARDHPATGTVLTTHDTKRSGDVRARIAVLAECPDRWAEAVAAVAPGPDRQLAWVAAQTVFGLAAREPARVADATLKAAKEAALHTSWTDPDPDYEAAVAGWLATARFEAVLALAAELAPHARSNVLSATLLHLTVPGVPEVYQGAETLYLALVDPDNRAPARLDGQPPAAGLPREKLGLTRAALRLRRDRPRLFGPGEEGGYRPLEVRGAAAEHCVAFCRGGGAVSVATRLPLGLARAGGWRDTAVLLPPGRWRGALDPGPGTGPAGTVPGGGWVPLAELLHGGPVALLADG